MKTFHSIVFGFIVISMISCAGGGDPGAGGGGGGGGGGEPPPAATTSGAGGGDPGAGGQGGAGGGGGGNTQPGSGAMTGRLTLEQLPGQGCESDIQATLDFPDVQAVNISTANLTGLSVGVPVEWRLMCGQIDPFNSGLCPPEQGLAFECDPDTLTFSYEGATQMAFQATWGSGYSVGAVGDVGFSGITVADISQWKVVFGGGSDQDLVRTGTIQSVGLTFALFYSPSTLTARMVVVRGDNNRRSVYQFSVNQGSPGYF